MFRVLSEFTNWDILDGETGYGFGYGYGCYIYYGDECDFYAYGYGYGYDPDSISEEEDTSDGGGAGSSSGPRWTDKNIDEDTVEESYDDFIEGNTPEGDTTNSPYGDEIDNAYQYAYSLGITTIGDVQSAMPEQGTTRAQLAKMMVQFATNALGKSIVASRVEMCSNSYGDVNVSLGDLADFITAACSMKIMGLEVDENTPLANFDPNKLVSRWEIITVLGRLIFGNAYKDMDPYYIGYMQAALNAGIITVNDPTLMDIRANIWIMLQRTHAWLAGE